MSNFNEKLAAVYFWSKLSRFPRVLMEIRSWKGTKINTDKWGHPDWKINSWKKLSFLDHLWSANDSNQALDMVYHGKSLCAINYDGCIILDHYNLLFEGFT